MEKKKGKPYVTTHSLVKQTKDRQKIVVKLSGISWRKAENEETQSKEKAYPIAIIVQRWTKRQDGPTEKRIRGLER